MKAKEHYEKHLSNFYSWMLGDIQSKSIEFQNFLESHEIEPKNTKTAIDLGAGNGIQSIALKELGYRVTAIDFNRQLLDELKSNPNAKGINTKLDNITNVSQFAYLKPELITCCGDTITHLDSKNHIVKLIKDVSRILENKGYLILTFRDYSKELDDKLRFIPVKSSSNRILTCILEYGIETIKVTDLLYEKINEEWSQKVSSYKKVRLYPNVVTQILKEKRMEVIFNKPINLMQTVIAKKIAYNGIYEKRD